MRAEEQAQEQGAAPTESSLFSSGSGKITGSLSFTQDKEGFQDVFAFAGELPEVCSRCKDSTVSVQLPRCCSEFPPHGLCCSVPPASVFCLLCMCIAHGVHTI